MTSSNPFPELRRLTHPDKTPWVRVDLEIDDGYFVRIMGA